MENYLRERAIAENSQFALMDFPFGVLAFVEANLDFLFLQDDLSLLQKLVREVNVYQGQDR